AVAEDRGEVAADPQPAAHHVARVRRVDGDADRGDAGALASRHLAGGDATVPPDPVVDGGPPAGLDLPRHVGRLGAVVGHGPPQADPLTGQEPGHGLALRVVGWLAGDLVDRPALSVPQVDVDDDVGGHVPTGVLDVDAVGEKLGRRVG